MGARGKFGAWLRGFFLSAKARECLVFAFFVAVAACFWLMVTLNDTFDIEVRVPLQLTGVPEGVQITTDVPRQVRVSVRDKGTMLIHLLYRRELRPVALNFASYDEGAVTARVQVPQNDVLRAVQSQLQGSTQIQGLRPDTIEFYYTRGRHYRFPVRATGTVSTQPQHYLLGVTTRPDSVDVYAPASVRDTMTAAYTQAVVLSGLAESTSQRVRLMHLRGVKYEPDEVEVTAMVDYYTEKSVTVPVIGLNFPADKSLRTFPAQATITFRVGSARYQETTAENFVLAFTYEEVLANAPSRLLLHLKSLPEGVSNVRISPQEVDYLIEQTAEEDSPEG